MRGMQVNLQCFESGVSEIVVDGMKAGRRTGCEKCNQITVATPGGLCDE